MFLFSLCHRRWASSLLFGSTRGNSFSWNERIKGMSQGARASTYRRWCFSVIGLSTLEQVRILTHKQKLRPLACGVFLTPMLRRRGDRAGSASMLMESTGDWYSHGLARSGELAHKASFSCTDKHTSSSSVKSYVILGETVISGSVLRSLTYLNVQPDTERVPKPRWFHSRRLKQKCIKFELWVIFLLVKLFVLCCVNKDIVKPVSGLGTDSYLGWRLIYRELGVKIFGGARSVPLSLHFLLLLHLVDVTDGSEETGQSSRNTPDGQFYQVATCWINLMIFIFTYLFITNGEWTVVRTFQVSLSVQSFLQDKSHSPIHTHVNTALLYTVLFVSHTIHTLFSILPKDNLECRLELNSSIIIFFIIHKSSDINSNSLRTSGQWT